MDYNLLIVGNGFDLGCGFKTSYNDFLDKITLNDIDNPLVLFFINAKDSHYFANNEWNGFEKMLCQYLQFINYFFTENDNVTSYYSEMVQDSHGYPFYRYFNWTVENIGLLPKNILLILNLFNPLKGVIEISQNGSFTDEFYGLENNVFSKRKLFFRVRVSAQEGNATKEYALEYVLNELDRHLTALEKSLKVYIESATRQRTDGPQALLGSKVERIVSFNYSDTAQRVYGIDCDKVAYVHGDVFSTVVLGVEPSMIRNQSFSEDSDYIKFFKRFRRFYKDCNKNYDHKIIEQIDSTSIVAIYGHSLDLSDKSILLPLFEKKCKRYDIYCYGDDKDYRLKLAKLIGLDLLTKLDNAGKIVFLESY